MTKAYILISMFLTISLTGISQTTLEEYNYVTKGYKIQMESGLDMKKGYVLEDVDAHTSGIRSASLKKLIKVNAGQKKIVAYMVIYQKQGSPKEFFCVPSPKSDMEVTDAYWTALYNGSDNNSAKLQLILFLITGQLNW